MNEVARAVRHARVPARLEPREAHLRLRMCMRMSIRVCVCVCMGMRVCGHARVRVSGLVV